MLETKEKRLVFTCHVPSCGHRDWAHKAQKQKIFSEDDTLAKVWGTTYQFTRARQMCPKCRGCLDATDFVEVDVSICELKD